MTDKEFADRKAASFSTALSFEKALALAGMRGNLATAMVGAYLLARAAWIQSASCSDEECPHCGAVEHQDFRATAMITLQEALDDIELFETQTEGRA